MLPRKSSRIELSSEDLIEYEEAKKQQLQKASEKALAVQQNRAKAAKTAAVHSRIGFTGTNQK